MKTRLTALILILALLLSCCTAFAESNALDSDSFLGKSTSFTYTISVNINSNFVNQYDEVAPLQYAMAKDWDPSGNGNTRKVDIKVIMLASGINDHFASGRKCQFQSGRKSQSKKPDGIYPPGCFLSDHIRMETQMDSPYVVTFQLRSA